MISLSETRFTLLHYNPASKLLKQIWKFNAFKNQLHFFGNLTEVLDIAENYEIKGLLLDFSNFTYCLSQDCRIWVVKSFLLQLNTQQIQQIAFVKSKDAATQQTLEILIQHRALIDHNIQFFEQTNQAEHWLSNVKKKVKPINEIKPQIKPINKAILSA